MVIKCLCFDGVKKTVKIVRFVLESCTFRFRDYRTCFDFSCPDEVFPFVGCYHFHCRQDILCAYDFVQAGIF